MTEYELARELKDKIAARMRDDNRPQVACVISDGREAHSYVTTDSLWELAKDIAELQVKVQNLLPTLPPPKKEPPPF